VFGSLRGLSGFLELELIHERVRRQRKFAARRQIEPPQKVEVANHPGHVLVLERWPPYPVCKEELQCRNVLGQVTGATATFTRSCGKSGSRGSQRATSSALAA
jgi:hypothetical protein